MGFWSIEPIMFIFIFVNLINFYNFIKTFLVLLCILRSIAPSSFGILLKCQVRSVFDLIIKYIKPWLSWIYFSSCMGSELKNLLHICFDLKFRLIKDFVSFNFLFIFLHQTPSLHDNPICIFSNDFFHFIYITFCLLSA